MKWVNVLYWNQKIAYSNPTGCSAFFLVPNFVSRPFVTFAQTQNIIPSTVEQSWACGWEVADEKRNSQKT